MSLAHEMIRQDLKDVAMELIENCPACIDTLARDLHEAGREAVLANKVHKKDGAPVGKIVFKEWDEIDEDAREGRRIQARYLVRVYRMFRRTIPGHQEPTEPKE